MLNRKILMSGILFFASMSTIAEVIDTGREFKEFAVFIENTNKIKLTFEYTEEVDSCNSHDLVASLHQVSDYYYLAQLSIIGTQMMCEDTTMHPMTFTETIEINQEIESGMYKTILAPKNTRLRAEAIK